MDGVGQARLAATEEVGEAAAHCRAGIVPQVEAQLGEPEVAAETAAGPDQAPVGVVVEARKQHAEALVADSDIGVARCERAGVAQVVDAALLEVVEQRLELHLSRGFRREVPGAEDAEARVAVGDTYSRSVRGCAAQGPYPLDLRVE